MLAPTAIIFKFCLCFQLEDDGPVDMPSLNPYIAARFEANSLPDVLKLGNKQMYDSHTNRPLDSDHTYRVFLRAYSVDPVSYISFIDTIIFK